MRYFLKHLFAAVAVALCASGLVRADTVIVVNFGPHPSAAVASRAEAKVNWLDAERGDDTVCTECFAAVELQRYLRKMTGRKDDFAIVDDEGAPEGELILVGGPASNALTRRLASAIGVDAKQLVKLGREGYRIKTATADGRRVTLIAGGSRVGTLYGSYDLLYRHGCRWFGPGEINEEVPRTEWKADFDVTGRPAFGNRGFFAWQDRGDADFLLWMARNRMNYWCAEQSNHPLMRKLGIQTAWGEHQLYKMFLDSAAEYPYNHPTFQGNEKKPRDPYAPGDQYQGDADGDGKLSYFEAHPEWYGLLKGRRIPIVSGASKDRTNYCTSNPDATAELMKNFVQAIVDGPCKDADIVRMWTIDHGNWCQCPKCKALGTPTDRNLLLVHRLDREIKKAQAEGRINRPVKVAFLAYADVVEPPSRPLPDDFDYRSCVATFFPVYRSYVHNIDDPGSPENAKYIEQLRGWLVEPKRHYRGQICIGEYYNISGFTSLPICFMHTMANDIPRYYKLGARDFHYMHCTTRDWGNKALTNYQMARQLWDVTTDCGTLWRDYFAKRYGPAAEVMRGFYESLEQMFSKARQLKYGLARRLDRGTKELFPDARLRYRRKEGLECTGPTFTEILASGKKCRELIDRAMAADLPERVKKRIAEDERLFTYGQRTVLYYDACVSAFDAARSGRVEEGRRYQQEANRLAELLRRDTTSAAYSYVGNAANAFVASRATGALGHLEELLGPALPAEVKCFDPAKQPFVLSGREFSGGGGQKYGQRQGGWELYVVPGKKKVSEQGNHVYAKPTGVYSRMTGWFRLQEPPKAPLRLTLIGLSCPVKDKDEIPTEIFVNDTSVYQGPCRFSIDGLGPHEIDLPANALKKGDNKIVIHNLAPEGQIGGRPWFGVDRAELRTTSAKPGR